MRIADFGSKAELEIIPLGGLGEDPLVVAMIRDSHNALWPLLGYIDLVVFPCRLGL